MTAKPSTCPNNATCPIVLPHPDGFLIVGTAVPDAYAVEHGANVAPDEAAVLLPQAVMDAHEKPLRDRIAELEQRLDVAGRQRDYAIGANRGLLESLSRMGEELNETRGENERLRGLTTLPPCPFDPPCLDCQHYAVTPPRVHWTPAAVQQPAAGPHHTDTTTSESE